MPDVAGHRVLRLLARGHRADSLLAFDTGEAAGDESGEDRGETVVIKRFHPTTSPDDVARELEALARAAGDHVVVLRDIGSEGGSACLIFERLAGGELTRLLRMRGSLDAGEAVTVLAPIAGALSRMHAAGVAHGAIASSSILFTIDGSPTLIGFGRAELFGPGSPEVVLESVPAVVADREALRALAVSVLSRIASAASDAHDLAAAVVAAPPHQLADLLSSRLFDLAAPAPVRFEVDQETSSTRALPVTEAVVATPPQRTGVLARLEPLLARLKPLSRLLEQDVVLQLRRELGGRWRALTPRFRRLLIGGLAAGGALTIALAASAPAAPTAPAAPSATGTTFPPAEVAEPLPDPELAGDDPVAATVVLLAVRDECFRSASLLCLDGVVQAGSSAEAADRAAVGHIQGGGEAPAPIVASRLELVERLGDSALVSLGPQPGAQTEPTSLLLMKGEAGWRIRDYIGAGA